MDRDLTPRAALSFAASAGSTSATAEGASPLQLQLALSGPEPGAVWFAVMLAGDATVALQESITVALSFDYLGSLELAALRRGGGPDELLRGRVSRQDQRVFVPEGGAAA